MVDKIPQLRDLWRGFKKKHPDFEKSRSGKENLGPLLDDMTKLYLEIGAAEKAMDKKYEALAGLEVKVREAVKVYVNQMTKDQKLGVAEFSKYYMNAIPQIQLLITNRKKFRGTS